MPRDLEAWREIERMCAPNVQKAVVAAIKAGFSRPVQSKDAKDG